MKKFFALVAVAALTGFGMPNNLHAQDAAQTTEQVVSNDDSTMADAADSSVVEEVTPAAPVIKEEPKPAVEVDQSFHQVLKEKFIQGGPLFMGVVLICLILGLALSIERIIYLNMSTTNSKKLLSSIEDALKSGGVEAAKEVCRNTPGPIASIFYQGLDRSAEGVDVVEKSVIAYGGVQMGLLEKGLSWISLFIALAPMLGFMGTVIGMIDAFDAIAAQNNISPAIVADGIKVALLTTVFGLIVAIILQVFYNYIVSKVDGIVNDMEDASISLIDTLVKHELTKK
jgi:biopolymer transport protein ExbB